MKKAIIFHGTCEKREYFSTDFPSLSNSHWLPWLQKQLLVKGYEAHTPEVKDAYMPSYDKWLKELNRYNIDEQTTLVGHSCGGGFLVRWMSESNVRVKKVILVAPWLNPDKLLPIDMFEFDINPKLASNADRVVVFSSKDDTETVQLSVKKIHDSVTGVISRSFTNYGHFTFGDMKTIEFPELLKEVLA